MFYTSELSKMSILVYPIKLSKVLKLDDRFSYSIQNLYENENERWEGKEAGTIYLNVYVEKISKYLEEKLAREYKDRRRRQEK